MGKSAIEKEWNKIKDYNIFANREEFEVLFNKNPNGKCFRKYTSFDWCKENFFFGTYDELLIFYKSNNEIPYYLNNIIGTRHYWLTINSFYRNENNDIVANCSCDCGQLVNKSYRIIKKGNCRSCGCKSKKFNDQNVSLQEKHPSIVRYWDIIKNNSKPSQVKYNSKSSYWWNCEKNHSYKSTIHRILTGNVCPQCNLVEDSMAKIYPTFCDKYWDYEKNKIKPNEISIKSSTKIWLKNDNGESYKNSPLKIFQTNNSTSFEEQCIYYYIKKFYPDAENRFKFITIWGEILEIDIFIPSQKIAIEYDGYWHNRKTEMDNYKRQEFNNNNLRVVSIREEGLPKLNKFKGITFKKQTKNSDKGLHLHQIVNKILTYLSKGEIKSKISRETILNDRQNIYAQYKTAFKEDNIINTCVMKYFDLEGNGRLNPNTVGMKDNTFVKFICPNNKKIDIKVRSLNLQSDCNQQYCHLCYRNLCPFIKKCFNGLSNTEEFCKDCNIYNLIVGKVEKELEDYGSASFNFSKEFEETLLNQDMIHYYLNNMEKIQTNKIEKMKFIDKYKETPISFLVFKIDVQILKELLILFENKLIRFDFHLFDNNKDDRLWLLDYLRKQTKSFIDSHLYEFYFRGNLNRTNLSKELKSLLKSWLSELLPVYKDYYRYWYLQELVSIFD